MSALGGTLNLNDLSSNPPFGVDNVNVIRAEGTQQANIPTMTEWGMIIFMVLAGLGSVYYLRRQRRTES